MFGQSTEGLGFLFHKEQKEFKQAKSEQGLEALAHNPLNEFLLGASDTKLIDLGLDGVLASAADYSKIMTPENNREGIQGGSMDGTEHAKYKDRDGQIWMAKTYPNERLHRAMVDELVARLSESLGLKTTMHAKTGLMNGGFKIFVKFEDVQGSLWDDLDAVRGDTAKLVERIPADVLKEMVAEQVLDWLVSNHDPHMGHFMKRNEGGLLCIDKAQAFKYMGDSDEALSTTYNPNAPFNGANNVAYKPAYNVLLPEIAAGHAHITLEEAWKRVDQTLKAVEAIDDETYKKALLPYAKFRFTVVKSSEDQKRKMDLDRFIELAMKRKQGIRKEFEELYGSVGKNEKQPDTSVS